MRCRGITNFRPASDVATAALRGIGHAERGQKHVLYPGGHEIFATQRTQIVQEVVGGLDRYVGRVQ